MHIAAFANGYLHCFALAPRAGDSAKVGEIIKGSHSFASLYQKAKQTKPKTMIQAICFRRLGYLYRGMSVVLNNKKMCKQTLSRKNK